MSSLAPARVIAPSRFPPPPPPPSRTSYDRRFRWCSACYRPCHPLTRSQTALTNLLALREVLGQRLGDLAPEHDAMPLGFFLPLATFVRPHFSGRHFNVATARCRACSATRHRVRDCRPEHLVHASHKPSILPRPDQRFFRRSWFLQTVETLFRQLRFVARRIILDQGFPRRASAGDVLEIGQCETFAPVRLGTRHGSCGSRRSQA